MRLQLNLIRSDCDEERRQVPARIVVVDDDEALRTAVRRALRLEGYDVELAADGLPLWVLAGAVGATVVVGALAGAYPAARAARMSPTGALATV